MAQRLLLRNALALPSNSLWLSAFGSRPIADFAQKPMAESYSPGFFRLKIPLLLPDPRYSRRQFRLQKMPASSR